MELESQMPSPAATHSAGGSDSRSSYPFACLPPVADGPDPCASWIVDWGPMMRELLRDHRHGVPVSETVSKFHRTLCEIMVQMARESGESQVVLSGGCFQNRYLTEIGVTRLRDAGFQVYWHQRVPPNDGGLALGQALAAALRKDR